MSGKRKTQGRRAGEVTTPHVYGRKRTVWGVTFTFGHDRATADARCLRLLALKTELAAEGARGWTPETKAKAWRIAKGQESAGVQEAGVQPEQNPIPAPAQNAVTRGGNEIAPAVSDTSSGSESPPFRTFYAALDAYLRHVERQGTKANDHSFSGRIKAQKRALPDLPIDRIGPKELRSLVAHWKAKPKALKTVWVEQVGRKVAKVIETEKRIGAISVKAFIGAARQFFNWLASEESGLEWDAPNLKGIFELRNRDFENLKGDAERIASVREKNVPNARHFTDDELAKLWDAALLSDLRRTYFLLALNCCFATSELAHLHVGDCYLDGEHQQKPFIAFIRNKTKRYRCYGKWYLWPETAKELRRAVQSVAARNPSGTAALTDLVFRTEEGNALVSRSPGGFRNDSVKMVWRRWARTAGIERLSWKHLRKTSSQRVRETATSLGLDGRYMQYIHLAHGDDEMTRAYNEPGESEYGNLGRVLAEVRKRFDFLDKPKVVVIRSSAATA